jgi:hypothetical protein
MTQLVMYTALEPVPPCLPVSHALCLPAAVILNKLMICLQIWTAVFDLVHGMLCYSNKSCHLLQ